MRIFHTAVNLLGCVGVFMENTGLLERLEQIYGKSVIFQMMQGNGFFGLSIGKSFNGLFYC